MRNSSKKAICPVIDVFKTSFFSKEENPRTYPDYIMTNMTTLGFYSVFFVPSTPFGAIGIPELNLPRCRAHLPTMRHPNYMIALANGTRRKGTTRVWMPASGFLLPLPAADRPGFFALNGAFCGWPGRTDRPGLGSDLLLLIGRDSDPL